MIKPNWKNCVLNVSATLSKLLGNQTNIPSIKMLEKVLAKNYKNVVYLCIDGLGMYPLAENLPKNAFLRANVKKTITSVFPSTTTNATTSIYSATYPSQHGYFGWSLWFEDIGGAVDIYRKADTYSGEYVEYTKDMKNYLSFEEYYKNNKSSYEVSTVFPSYVKTDCNNIPYNKIEEMFTNIKNTISNEKKNFVFGYLGEPDGTMHNSGVSSPEARAVIEQINAFVEDLASNAKDTCIIITPDHGQRNISGYIELYKDKELLDSLRTPPFLEARAVAFNVKNEEKFLKAIKKYKADCKLYKIENLIKQNYFGPYTNKLKMLGDYILVMKDVDKIFLFSENHPRFKGHHTALSKKEMVLPLIIIEKD